MYDVGVYPESMSEDWRKSPSGDFVSRQWLLTEYDKRHKGPPGGARKMIEEAPPVDVRPVKEGHWIEDRTDYVCSACGGRVSDEIVFMLQSEELPDYCPNCGADMTGGADG